jgi:DNA-directed RNA polymerase beta subunit
MNTDVSHLHDLPLPDHLRGFHDPDKTRQWMRDNVISAFNEHLNKIETPDFKLRVKNIQVEDPNKHFTLKEQKQAVLERKSLTNTIKGDVDLLNKKTGEVTGTKKNTVIAHLPWLTNRNTVIQNGNEYQLQNQQRLKPGIFTRLKETGEVEAHFSPEAGSGLGGKLIMDPAKATFVYEIGSAQVGLYGFLKDMGVSDEEMKQAWGDEIWLANKKTYKGNEVDKFYAKVFSYD